MDIGSLTGSPAIPLPAGADHLAAGQGNRSPQAIGEAFESMFASLLVKQMRQNADGESLFPSDAGDVLGGMFDQFLGDHLGKSGALGIGAMIRAQLERRQDSV